MTPELRERTAVVVNRHAGTVRSMGEDAVRQLIVEALGAEADIGFAAGPEIGRLLRRHIEDGNVARLIVGGGDGTLASAATLAARKPIAIGVLPLGTMNLMAQTIGMDAALAGALKQIADAQVQVIDVGRANGSLFLHHAAFGLQPRMVRIRERMGYSSRLTKMLAAVRASIAVLLNPKAMRLGLRIDGEAVAIRTPGLVVSNNIYENALMLKQRRLDERLLGLYALEPMSLPAFLRLAFDALRGRWRDNDNVQEWHGRSVQLTRRHRFGRDSRSIKATLDGELALLDLPLELASEPAALRLLVPRGAAP